MHTYSIKYNLSLCLFQHTQSGMITRFWWYSDYISLAFTPPFVGALYVNISCCMIGVE